MSSQPYTTRMIMESTEIIFAWEAANLLGLSSSKFLRTVAEEIPHTRKGGVRLYKRDVVERWREKRITSGV